MTTTRWWWIRHAPVLSDGSIYGQMDVPADVSDRTVFAALASVLPARAVWVVSQLQRTHQTAEAILAANGESPAPIVEAALAEQHFGDLQGRPREAVYAELEGGWNRFWLTGASDRPPGGESFADVTVRVREAIERLSRAHAGRDIVAVAHGGTIRAALAHAMDLAPAQALAFVVDNCSLTCLHRIDPPHTGEPAAWRVALVNHDARGSLRPGC